MANAVKLLELIDSGRDFYSPAHKTELKRLFGGQTVAQCLFAAAQSVPQDFYAHSLHGYFVNAAKPNMPLSFQVTILRDGRSFVTRQVDAFQNGHMVFTLLASFTKNKVPGLQHSTQVTFPGQPIEFEKARDIVPQKNAGYKYLCEWEDWDLRLVPSSRIKREGFPAQLQIWARYTGEVPSSIQVKQALLAYMSDMTLISTIREPHHDVAVQNASLDHTIWFFDDYEPSEWHFYDVASPWANYGRGLAVGRVFNQEGILIAQTSQEGLVRYYSQD